MAAIRRINPRVALEGAIEGSGREHTDVSRNPYLVSAGARFFFLGSRRLYLRLAAGAGGVELMHPDGAWKPETLFGLTAEMGYAWEAANWLRLGPYVGLTSMVNDVHSAGFYSLGVAAAYQF